jgi:hypothetical protein
METGYLGIPQAVGGGTRNSSDCTTQESGSPAGAAVRVAEENTVVWDSAFDVPFQPMR